MPKANTKPFDRMIRNLEAQLRSVRNGEISALSAGEKVRAVAHIGRGVHKVARGKSTNGPDAAVDRVFAGAEERIDAELQAAKKARQQAIADAATATVAKRAESIWW